MIKALVVHNAYQLQGGEDAVVEAEIQLLRSRGHDVQSYFRRNSEIDGRNNLGLARDTFWSSRTAAEVAALIREFQPSVVHVHNTFPLISPSIYSVCTKLSIPVVQTLHNFRLICPQAMLLRDGKVCEDCVGRVPWRAAVHACYRDSRPQSAVMAAMLTVHRTLGTYRDGISRYIALTDFARDVLIRGGLPADRVVVKPNFVEDVSASGDVQETRSGFLFVGRLSSEKGIATLLEAVSGDGRGTVDIVGDGPSAGDVMARPQLRSHGWQDQSSVRVFMRRAVALLMPSIWYEGFPRTIVEAFACGLPVIASRLGSMQSLIRHGETGLLFEPGNAAELARTMTWANENPAAMAAMGQRARQEYLSLYTPGRNYDQLMAIYRDSEKTPVA